MIHAGGFCCSQVPTTHSQEMGRGTNDPCNNLATIMATSLLVAAVEEGGDKVSG